MSIEQPLEKPTGGIFYASTELPGFAGIISEVLFVDTAFSKINPRRSQIAFPVE